MYLWGTLQGMDRKFLWQPDPTSSKDWPAAPILKAANMKLPTLPTAVKLDAFISEILNQGGLGSCTANSVAQGIHAAGIRLGFAKLPYPSRLFLYYFARAILGTTQIDSGAHVRCIFDVLRKLGFCPESAWSYDDGPQKFKILPDAGATRLAYDQLGGLGYYRIDSTGLQLAQDLRTAVAAGYTVSFGTLVSNKFAEFKPDSAPLDTPTSNETILGGHALLVAGYDQIDDFFWVVNSWGPDYGINGWLKMRSTYVAGIHSSDFWITETPPDFSERL